MEPYNLIKTLTGHTNYISSIATLPNSNIVSGGLDKTIKIWQSVEPFSLIATLNVKSNIYSLAILPNSNIVSGSLDKTIRIWQPESPFECIATLYGHSDRVNTLAILPNSNIVKVKRLIF